jgi:tRNA (uracil-5-)-methyltransferase
MGWGVGRVQLEAENGSSSYPTTTGTATTVASTSKTDEMEGEETTMVQPLPPKEKEQRLWVVMVPHVVRGELVRVRIFRNMKNYSEADLIEVVEPSPDRVEPKCSLAGICGGCQYQHMSITAQRQWKTWHVQEVLMQQAIQGYEEEASLAAKLSPTLGTEQVYGYRSKLTPHYQAPDEIEPGQYEMQAIGFQKSSNRQLVDVVECPIATPAINAAFHETRTRLLEQARQGLLNNNNNSKKKSKRKRRGSKDGDLGATLLFRQADDDPETGKPVVVTNHNEYMTTTIKGIQFRYLAGNFFQNNNHVIPLMVDAVLDAATRPILSQTTEVGQGGGEQQQAPATAAPSYLIDCYCGSGLFALSAAKRFNVCVGIELNERAIDEATANAISNGIDNCHFVAASAEAIFTSPPTVPVPVPSVVVEEDVDGSTSGGDKDDPQVQLLKVSDFPRDQTVVVLDPPRKGCSVEFLEQLYEYSPQRIVYMSCGPATQARDAKGIVEIGGYEIVSIQPFDLFPQTKHVECLMVFEKKKKSE